MTARVDTTATHRYMVLDGKSLMAQGIAHLLATQGDTDVNLTNIEEADPVEAVRSINPDVLILDANGLGDQGNLLVRLLKECPTTTIVGLDSMESRIYILRIERRAVGDAQEFLATLRENL